MSLSDKQRKDAMKTISLALVGALAIGCSTATSATGPAQTAVASSAPLAGYRTFSFGFTEDAPRAYHGSARSLEVQHRMRELLAATLTQRGYVQDSTKPDFVVRFGAGTRDVEKATAYDGESPVLPESFTLGGMKVDIYDASNKTEVWQGSVASKIDLTRPIDDAVVQRAVQDVLATFPPRSAATVEPAANPLASSSRP